MFTHPDPPSTAHGKLCWGGELGGVGVKGEKERGEAQASQGTSGDKKPSRSVKAGSQPGVKGK